MVPELALEVTGWPTLQGGFHYEGWAIVDGSPVTTGKFNVQAGILVDLDGQAVHVFSAEGIESATAIVITIEPAGDIVRRIAAEAEETLRSRPGRLLGGSS